MSKNNQLIAYLNKREKLQDKRDLGPTTPLSAAYYQSSRNYPWKFEWTSVLSSKLFLDVLAGNWYNFFPLRPQTEFGNFPVEDFVPGRLDVSAGNLFAGGANDTYQDQKRFKPQFHAFLSFFQNGWMGNHDFKVGFEARRDRRKLGNDQPFGIFYRDQGASSAVDLFNSPVEPINDVNVRSVYAQDSWKLSNRLTLNLGLRVDHYTDGWPEQNYNPTPLPQLAGTTDQRIIDFYTPKTIQAQVVSKTTTVGPRAGFAVRPARQHEVGHQGVLRPLLLQLGRPHCRQPEPRRVRTASLPVRAVHGDGDDPLRSEWQPPARQPGGARQLHHDAPAAAASSRSIPT